MSDVNTLRNCINLAQVASCNCDAKTNEPAYHDPWCRYRVLSEAGDEIDRLSPPGATVAAERENLAQWFATSDGHIWESLLDDSKWTTTKRDFYERADALISSGIFQVEDKRPARAKLATVDRESLAQWFFWNIPKPATWEVTEYADQCAKVADALIASGLLSATPEQEG